MYKLPFFLLANKLYLLSYDVLCEKKKKRFKEQAIKFPKQDETHLRKCRPTFLINWGLADYPDTKHMRNTG